MNLDWHARAACRDHPDPDMWFPGPGVSRRAQRAVEICQSCPVQIECAQHAAGAAKHELCTNPIKPGQPLPGGRLVHTARLTDRRREK